MLKYRPTVSPFLLSFATACIVMLAYNHTFLAKASSYMAGQTFALVCLGLGFFLLHLFGFVLAQARYIFKPILLLFIIGGGLTSWFVDSFGVIIDRDMIRNVAESTVAESNNLITYQFVVHLLLFVILPTAVILWVKVDFRPPLKQAMWNLIYSVPLFAAFAALALLNSSAYFSTFRIHRDLIKYLNPSLPIGATLKYALDLSSERKIVAEPIGEDAKIVRNDTGSEEKPRVLIMVIGETARAMNFSLNGYARKTNPELEKQDIINFPKVTSCGTNTAYSLPCMFSIETRSSFTHKKAKAKYNVADVLAQAGATVEWWDNNTGDKNIAERITLKKYMNETDKDFCFDGECQDGILLRDLDAWLDNVKGDSVLFLHTLGSHGPTYFKRYPEEYRLFKPDCRTAEMANCSDEQIVNSYDNTIAYTDHIVSEVINQLKEREGKLAGAVMYLSDHGESLGENGIYLHSMPYRFAPKEQTTVPMLFWFSKDFAESGKINQDCLRKKTNAQYSHDNLFHTLLGLMDVSTSVRDPELDIVSSCKEPPVS